MPKRAKSQDAVYIRIMEALFKRHKAHRQNEFDWQRSEITDIAHSLGAKVPANLGDNIYAIRHGRNLLPDKIVELAQPRHWLLLPNGKSKYRFVKAKNANFELDRTLRTVKVPNSTPQIVEANALTDEQAVLARIRYNRLIDLFLGVNAFALQSHLRTTVEHFRRSQIETDEIYVAVDKAGVQYVIPVQAKGRHETIGAVQAIQDIYCCQEKFPRLVCRAVAAKTVDIEKHASGVDIYTVGLMELGIEPDTSYDVTKIQERHFELVLHGDITENDLAEYRKSLTH